jgi:hypothetical protein
VALQDLLRDQFAEIAEDRLTAGPDDGIPPLPAQDRSA